MSGTDAPTVRPAAPAAGASAGAGHGAAGLKSYVFRKEREATWRDLEGLVTAAERRGARRLAAADLSRLATLYRATLSSLSVARSISLDRNVVVYLEALAARAYVVVYGPKRSAGETLRDFVTERLPRAVRAARGHVALSALFLLLGVVCGMALTLADPGRFYSFVAEGLAAGRTPTASTEFLRSGLYDSLSVAEEGMFSTFLMTHNMQVGLLAFALGFMAGVPVFLLLFTNGLMLGAFAALYQSRGLGLDFWGWVLPHGVPELTAVVLAGAAGLLLAESLVFPGRHTRIENLRLRGRDAGVVALGAVCLFGIAAPIEGFFRQEVHAVDVRYLVAGLGAVLITFYFTRVGRVGAASEPSR